MKILKNILFVLIITALCLWGYEHYRTSQNRNSGIPEIPCAAVEEKNLTAYITGAGEFEAHSSVTVSAPFSGKVIRLCEEGSMVEKGDFLAELDVTDLLVEERQNKLLLEQSLADIAESRESLRILRISSALEINTKISQMEYDTRELETAKNTLERQKRLLDEQIVTLQNVEQEESNVRTWEAAVRKDRIAVEEARKKSESDIRLKEREIVLREKKAEKAKLDYEDIRTKVEQAVVRAPRKGLVILSTIYRGNDYGKLVIGDDISKDKALVELPDLSRMYLSLMVPENYIQEIYEGQKVEISIKSKPGKIFEGTVEKVPQISSGDFYFRVMRYYRTLPGGAFFKVRVAVTNEDNQITPGITATARFIVSEVQSAAVLPVNCVFGNEQRKYIWLKKNGDFIKQPVETGISNYDFIEIRSGASKGDAAALTEPVH